MKKNQGQTFEFIPAYFESIIQNSTDAILGKTLDGVITSWNKAAEELYGYKAAEIIGDTIYKVIPQDRIKEIKDILKKIKGGQRIERYQTVRMTKDGRHLQVSVTISPILNSNGKVIGASAIAHDITLERTLSRQQEFMNHASTVLNSSLNYAKTLQSVADLATEYIADWCAIDLLTAPKEVKLVAVAHKDPRKVAWAKEFRQNFPVQFDDPQGVAKVIMSGKSELYSHITEEMLAADPRNKKNIEIIKKIGMQSVMIVPIIIRKKARGAITFVSSSPVNLFTKLSVSFAEDLARRAAQAIDNATLYKQVKEELEEREKVQSALRESENKYQKLFDSSIIGVVVGKAGVSMSEVNDTFLKMIGYSRDDFEQNRIPIDKMTPDKWLDGNARAIEELRHFGESSTWEKEFIRKDGTLIPVLVGSTMLNAKTDTILTFVLDTSERKEFEQRKDDFISVASHELKTPITSMKVFTQLLAKRFEKQEDAQTVSLIKKLDTQLNKLIILISDLLDVSRIHAGKLELRLEDFLITELVKETVESLEETTPHKIYVIDGKNIIVHGDRERIGQVVTNFLTNAIKYSPPHKDIKVYISGNKKEVSVGVQDFGIGISAGEKDKIFERFYQAKGSSTSTFPGLGMGLYICSEIIQRHGGKITVESKKGKGSHFIFTIPLHHSLIKTP